MLLSTVAQKPTVLRPSTPDVEGFLTSDSATRKALERVNRCIEAQSDVVWIEGESGTGKSLLARILAHKQSERAAHPYQIGVLSLPEVQVQRIAKHGFDALFVHIPATVTLQEIRLFQQQISAFSRLHSGKLRFLCLMSLSCQSYVPVVARHLSLMKQVFVDNYFEYITLQPLRNRQSDILLLAEHIMHQFNAWHFGITPEVELQRAQYIAYLQTMDFEDNVWGLQRACLHVMQHGILPMVQMQELAEVPVSHGRASLHGG
jgi:transcriptional regulator of aromatic amino acid metabolism